VPAPLDAAERADSQAYRHHRQRPLRRSRRLSGGAAPCAASSIARAAPLPGRRVVGWRFRRPAPSRCDGLNSLRLVFASPSARGGAGRPPDL